MAVLHSFDDVQCLEADQLNKLLEHGRPEERVWALWALALRSTEISELARRAEPDAGVRRHLAVMLAGHGEHELLVGLAKRDPAPEVRAAALQLVARLAVEGVLPPAIVTERLAKEGSEVRVAVLGTIEEGAPAWLLDAAERLLGDRDLDVRYEAFEAIIRGGRLAPALMWLEETNEADCKLVLVRWAANGRIRACADALGTSSRRLRRLFVESVRATAWTEVEPVVGDDPSLIRTVGGKNPKVATQIPLAVLVRAALNDGSDTWIMLIRDRLRALETPHEVSHVLPEYREMCAKRIADIDAQVAELRGQKTDGAIDEASMLEGLRGAFETVYDHASRLIVH